MKAGCYSADQLRSKKDLAKWVEQLFQHEDKGWLPVDAVNEVLIILRLSDLVKAVSPSARRKRNSTCRSPENPSAPLLSSPNQKGGCVCDQ